jgi:hypothetical protein
MLQQFLIQSGAPIPLVGTLQVLANRLLVFSPIALTIMGILCVFALYGGLTFLYVETHRSILYEEPIGLAGAAALLSESRLLEDVLCVKAMRKDGKIHEQLEENDDWNTSGWKIHRWDSPPMSRLVKTISAAEPSYKSSFKKNF